ncbi:Fur family ferric uptake transcriptional regulator [Paraburkholderia bannensis]|uniref:Ferric uptake regulation protein n=1 Tax=Paraburkholderia bannensis TaxID=765414 RepID=A0A7W9TUW6_9BURK|nr:MULTISPECIES: transcriptional repressor [Paraburkholderia]MBB3256928.1 Fur family ferric uptake transcriptional regulator [Paraburkholderia sp. WP4_3_2]MBB6101882.1 Fur family ferric uptake transcriptional regulator [Paraburkholderia bannensis]
METAELKDPDDDLDNPDNADLTAAAVCAFLRSKGLNVTKTRLHVLALLSEFDRPVSGETLFRHIIKKRESMSKATIYRTLVEFEKAGVVSRQWVAGLTGARAAYVSLQKPRGETFHQIVCRDCERRHALADDGVLERIRQALREEAALGSRPQPLTIYYLCTGCAGRNPLVGMEAPN